MDLYELLGTQFANQKKLLQLIEQQPNIFAGWVDSYNDTNKTVNVVPAIQDNVVDIYGKITTRNKPYLINCWVIVNTLGRTPQKGDKCLVCVLDEKSNNFFKAPYNSSEKMENQTFAKTDNSYKDISNCVAIIYNPNSAGGGETPADGVLTIKRNGSAIQTFSANQATNVDADITVPTQLTDLTNNGNFVQDANYVHTDNNFTTSYKDKLDGIASNAQVNVIETVKVNGSALTPENKAVDISVPTNTNQLTNGAGFITASDIPNPELFYCTYGSTTCSQIQTALSENKLPVLVYSNNWAYLRRIYNSGYYFVADKDNITTSITTYYVTSDNVWHQYGQNPELSTNKVISISSASTDTQYPSAKCVYNEINNVREIAAGKTATYVCSDITNTALDSQNASITITSALTDINSQTIALADFNVGDDIYIIETNVPDRWVSAITKSDNTVTSITLEKLETAKVPVADVQVNGTSIVTNNVANLVTNTAYDATNNKIATMSDLPTVNNGTLTIQKNGTNVATFSANSSSNVTANLAVPTKTSELTNDGNGTSNFATLSDLPPTITITTTSGSESVSDGTNTLSFGANAFNSTTIPTVNNPTITITQGGITKGSFTLNQSSAQTIALDAGGGGGSDLLNAIYPIGSLYMSVDNTSPASFLGGTWTQLAAGYALWTASSNAGDTIAAKLPNISGSIDVRGFSRGSGSTYATIANGTGVFTNSTVQTGPNWSNSLDYSSTSRNTDVLSFDASQSNAIYDSNATTVQPPAIKVYVWKRVADAT